MNYIEEAYKQALKCHKSDDVPVGAVIVCNGSIISKSYNKREKKNDPLAHAEILAIKKASKKLNTWHLNDCEMYVTLEPCLMCSGLIEQVRIRKVYYGASDSKEKGISSLNTVKSECLEHQKSSKIVKDFFKNKRK